MSMYEKLFLESTSLTCSKLLSIRQRSIDVHSPIFWWIHVFIQLLWREGYVHDCMFCAPDRHIFCKRCVPCSGEILVLWLWPRYSFIDVSNKFIYLFIFFFLFTRTSIVDWPLLNVIKYKWKKKKNNTLSKIFRNIIEELQCDRYFIYILLGRKHK